PATTLNVCAALVPPPSPPTAGVCTVRLYVVPAVLTSVALNATLSSVAELYVVARALPLTCTTDAAVNPLPPACTVTAPVPATTLAGVRLVSSGVGGLSATVSVALCAITIPSFTHRYTYVPSGTGPIPPPRTVTFPLATVLPWPLNFRL